MSPRRILLAALLLIPVLAAPARANWVASGTFRYRDRIQDLTGFTGATQDLAIRYAKVEVVRGSTVVGTGVTDASGSFSITATDSQTGTVFCRVISVDNISGLTIRVQSTTSSSSTYAVASSSVGSHNPNTNVNFGTIVALAGAGGEAFNIFDVMVECSDYAALLLGSYPGTTCTAIWSSTSTEGTYYSSNVIRLLAEEGWDDAVIAHEHGHFLDLVYSASDSPGGEHYLGDNNQDIRLSYGEGVATYHLAAGRLVNGRSDATYYIDTTGGSGAGNLSFSYEIEGPGVSAIGGASEVAVSAALWDIVDAADTPDDYTGDDDPLALSPTEVWQVMSDYIPSATNISLEDFWDGWFDPSINNGYQADMETTFGALTIEYFSDALEADGSAATASLVAPTGAPQHHTFYGSGDYDYARFTSPAASTAYVVETASLFGDANTSIQILDHDGSTVLASNDNRSGTDESSLLVWTAPGAGDYFVRSFHASDLGVYGSWDLRVVQGAVSTVTFTNTASTAGVNSALPGRGSAWGDYDGDGDPDLFVTNTSGNSYLLYRNGGAGTFTNVASTAGVTGAGSSGEACVWGDYDNDGDLDLFVAVVGTNILYSNDGDGTFTNVAATAGVDYAGSGSLGASWADYDRDGHLDLFVATMDANDRLYHNDGDGTFTEVGAARGVAGSIEDTFGGVWADYDGDQDVDLFVFHDSTPNHLFRNDGGAGFTDVTPALMIEAGVRSWGAVWTDYDHDADFDLFVSNMGSPCRLYRNDGSGTFTEAGAAAGVNISGSQTACLSADFDFDRDDDIYVGAYGEANTFFDNLTGAAFYNSGKAAVASETRSASVADYNGDGDLDIFVVLGDAANLLYSSSGVTNPWVRLRLQGVASNRTAIGATVTLRSGGRRQVQTVSGGSGYLSQNDQRLTFGLGSSAGPDTIDIRWPSGAFQRVIGLARSATHTIVEEDQSGVALNEAPRPWLELAQNHPNPFNPMTRIRFNIGQAGRTRLEILDVSGRLVRSLLDGMLEAGVYEEAWDGRGDDGLTAASGVYFYRLTGPGGVLTRKMILAR